jgi:hypothetical protein
MQSIYTSGTSSYGMANLYQPAGVININSSYANLNTNQTALNVSMKSQNSGPNYTGNVQVSNPTVLNSSITPQLIGNNLSFQKVTNDSYSAQHIDYQQNPSPIKLK